MNCQGYLGSIINSAWKQAINTYYSAKMEHGIFLNEESFKRIKRLKTSALGLQKKWEVLCSIYLCVGKPRPKHETHGNKELNYEIQEKKKR